MWRSTLTETPVEPSSVAMIGSVVAHDRLGVLTNQEPSLEVVGCEERVGRVHRLGRRIERDDEHARIASLLDGGHDRLGVAGVIRMPCAPAVTIFSMAVT